MASVSSNSMQPRRALPISHARRSKSMWEVSVETSEHREGEKSATVTLTEPSTQPRPARLPIHSSILFRRTTYFDARVPAPSADLVG
jgi:hypothetical protein